MGKVKIGLHDYQIEFVKSVNKFESRKGEIDFYKRVIRIDDDLTKDDQFETLIHEILHGIEEFMDLDMEEDQVKGLSCGLAMVLKDNSQMFSRVIADLSPEVKDNKKIYERLIDVSRKLSVKGEV